MQNNSPLEAGHSAVATVSMLIWCPHMIGSQRFREQKVQVAYNYYQLLVIYQPCSTIGYQLCIY